MKYSTSDATTAPLTGAREAVWSSTVATTPRTSKPTRRPTALSSIKNLDSTSPPEYPLPAVGSVAKARRVGRLQRAQSGSTAPTIQCGLVVTTPCPPLIRAARRTEDERQHSLPLTSGGKSRRSVRFLLTQCVGMP